MSSNPIIINELPDRVNINPITIRGVGDPLTNVEILVGPDTDVGNAERQGLVGTDEYGNFMYGGVFLTEGNNHVFARETTERVQDITKLQSLWNMMELEARRTFLLSFSNSMFDNMQYEGFYSDRSASGSTAHVDIDQSAVYALDDIAYHTVYYYAPEIEKAGVHTAMLLADQVVPAGGEINYVLIVDGISKEIDPNGDYLAIDPVSVAKIQLRVEIKTNGNGDTPKLYNYALLFE